MIKVRVTPDWILPFQRPRIPESFCGSATTFHCNEEWNVGVTGDLGNPGLGNPGLVTPWTTPGNPGDLSSIPRLGISPEKGNSYAFRYSGLENSMDCMVHGVAKSQKWLSDFHFNSEVCQTVFTSFYSLFCSPSVISTILFQLIHLFLCLSYSATDSFQCIFILVIVLIFTDCLFFSSSMSL